MKDQIEKIFKSDGQKTGELALTVDWNKHPLGPISGWPKALLVSLGVIFNSKHPMCFFWSEKAYSFSTTVTYPSSAKKKKKTYGNVLLQRLHTISGLR